MGTQKWMSRETAKRIADAWRSAPETLSISFKHTSQERHATHIQPSAQAVPRSGFRATRA